MSVTLLVGDLKYEWKLITWILFCKIILKDNLPFCSWKIKNGTLFCVLSIDYIIHDMENQCPFSQGSDISSLKKTFFMKGGPKCPTHCCYRPPDDNFPSVSSVSSFCPPLGCLTANQEGWSASCNFVVKDCTSNPPANSSQVVSSGAISANKVHFCCDDATVSFPISSECLTEGQHLHTGDKWCVLCIVVSETTDRAWLSLCLSHKHQNHYLIVIVKESKWVFLCEDFILMTEWRNRNSSYIIQGLDISDNKYQGLITALIIFQNNKNAHNGIIGEVSCDPGVDLRLRGGWKVRYVCSQWYDVLRLICNNIVQL